MMLHTTSRRLAATVAATALSAGALAAVAVPAANAATTPVTTVYTCANPAVTFKATLLTDTPGLPAEVYAGTDVPADLLAVTNKVTVTAQTYGLFAFLGTTEISLPDFAVAVGADKIDVTGLKASPASFTPDGAGNYSAQINGKNAAFDAPRAGTHSVSGPASFTLRATKTDGSNVDLPCTADAVPAAITEVTTTKNVSVTKAKAAKKVSKVGKAVKLKVAVAADNETPSGVVKVLKGKKVLGKGKLKSNGKVNIKLKKMLRAGVTKVKVSYLGDDFTEASTSKKIKLRVG